MTKGFTLLAAVAALSACSQPAGTTPAATDTATEAPSATASTAPVAMEIDGKPMAGTFDIASADGKRKVTQTVNADGTVATMSDGKTVKGTWTSTGPGHFCITNEGEPESCYTETLEADGTMKSVNDKDPKEVWMIKRVS